MATPDDVLTLLDAYFSGGSHLHSAEEDGLRALLQGLASRVSIRSGLVNTAAYTLVQSDAGYILEVDPAAAGGTVTITLPPSLDVGSVLSVRPITAGTVQFAAGTGVTIDSVSGLSDPLEINGQWAQVSLEVRAADTWLVTGQLAV